MDAARRLAIGTVQFGLDYGVSNERGKVSTTCAGRILRQAGDAGISFVDTAASYGDAEAVLAGLLADLPRFRVVTKTLPAAGGNGAVVDRARLSAKRFGRESSYALLVHAAGDLRASEGPALWRALLRLREEGLFAKIGISAYGTEDPADLARRFRPDIMQLPVSVLDQRLVQGGALAIVKSLGVEIHARSAFLQGAIFLDPLSLPPGLAHARTILVEFHARLARHGLTPLQAALGFPLSIAEIDRVVVGVTSAEELGQVLAAANAPHRDRGWAEFAVEDETLLDPRKWRA